MLSLINEILNISDFNYVLISLIISIATYVVGYVFMAIAIWVMAKRLNINKGRWMAFVPFLNWYLLGKVIGSAVVWGKKIDNVGLWLMLLSIAQTVITILLSIGSYLLIASILFDVSFVFSSPFLQYWVMGTGLLYEILSFVSLGVDIAFIFFEVSVIFLVFRLYAPESALLFSLLSLFLDPPLFGILLFVVRNRERKSFKQYYNVYNPYANYNNGQNGNPFQSPNQNKPQNNDVDPFPEFSSGKDNSSAKSDDSDEIFS